MSGESIYVAVHDHWAVAAVGASASHAPLLFASCAFWKERLISMNVVGWIVFAWLVGSILYSLGFAFRAALVMPQGYLARMIFIQLAKAAVAALVFGALTK